MLRVAVLDMQPIEPAVGGGRIRLLGLYHNLGSDVEARYVGTFDWPGEQRRNLRLTPTLSEIDVPLSEAHFAENRKWTDLAGGVNLIDTAFPILGRLSPAYVEAANQAIDWAEVVIISHPWVYPLVCERIRGAPRLLVYDAHNAESVLRRDLLGDRPFNRQIARSVAVTESTLARAADMVVVCSDGDAEFFETVCGVDNKRLYLAPNGVFAEQITPPSSAERISARRALGLSGSVAIFVGSNYAPNVDAVRFISDVLCPRFPDVTFAACGGVGTNEGLQSGRASNLMLPGVLTEDYKIRYLHAADYAVNPMFAGSGTNIKMFDFMAAGLPVVTTPIGARGIAEESTAGLIVADRNQFPQAINLLLDQSDSLRGMGRANRAWVCKKFAWEGISPALGQQLRSSLDRKSRESRDDVASAPSPKRATASPAQAVQASRPLAILSTWGVHCGIAEYTAYLTTALNDHGVPVVVIGNEVTQEEGALNGSHTNVQAPVTRLWRWDNVRWKDSSVNVDAICRHIEETAAQALSIQYHPGFFNEKLLVDLVSSVRKQGIPVAVTLHNSNISALLLSALAREKALVFVHRQAEAERLARDYPGGVRHLLMGVVRRQASTSYRAPQRSGGPVLATFGFLRPHKGLLELLQAVTLLRGTFPGLSLLARCALYPSDDSRQYHERVVQYISETGLDRIELNTQFVDLGQTIDALAGADVIVLPYAPSDEGASGSLATVMSACRPVIVAESPIFKEVSEYAYYSINNQPDVLAAAIATVLSNPDLYVDLEHRAQVMTERSDWSRVSQDFLEAIMGCLPTVPAPA